MMICLMWSYLVSQSEITLASLQQEPCDVRVAPLRCEHQRCGSLAVLDVSVCPTAKQQANHHNSAMSHCQVQSCLARLCGEGESVRPRPRIVQISSFFFSFHSLSFSSQRLTNLSFIGTSQQLQR